jgi:hypothetical protein
MIGMPGVYHDPALLQVNSGRNKNLINIAHIQNNTWGDRERDLIVEYDVEK